MQEEKEINVIQGWRGPYVSIYIPSGNDVSPFRSLRLAQTLYIGVPEKRLKAIKALLRGVAETYKLWEKVCLKRDDSSFLGIIQKFTSNIEKIKDVKEGLGVEGIFHRDIFEWWGKKLPAGFEFNGRNRQPPRDPINAVISYGNSLMYKLCVPPLQKAGFNTGLGFLHQPGRGRHTLALDVAELVKPIFVEAVCWIMVNDGRFTKDMVTVKAEGCFLNSEGKKLYKLVVAEMAQKVLGEGEKSHFGWPASLLKTLEVASLQIRDDLIKDKIPQAWVLWGG
ncbi:CRISPR-associated endonuclease Cas1 [Thermovirga lienii]|uniref:CRISPR-associated endonuclease Cas1 n=1 Tax=Thermovirga lienii TaxID=336261 RepID=UPI0026533647|nr:CRISP-associated protein Cas1 [Thermovirga sp.]MDN5368611.1 CRISP-associated protein Cas1 [Thermovirga sp.]